jgi:hypothetical protein
VRVTDRQGKSKGMTTSAPTEAEAALRSALLDTLITYPRHFHDTPEGLTDVAWEYRRAADRAHPAVAQVLREAAERIVE